MSNAFQTGDRVRANHATQLLNLTEVYTVSEVHENPTPFGNFVTYIVRGNDGEPIAVDNGHLILRHAEDSTR